MEFQTSETVEGMKKFRRRVYSEVSGLLMRSEFFTFAFATSFVYRMRGKTIIVRNN